jgi:flagellar biosynthetic protein FliQ
MTDSQVIAIISKALTLTLVLILPVIIPALLTGLGVSIFQALTQIQENSLTFLPKLIVVFFVLALLGNWMLDKVLNFTKEIFLMLPFR